MQLNGSSQFTKAFEHNACKIIILDNRKSNKKNFYKCDLTKEKEIISVARKIKKKFKKIDVLINNAANNYGPGVNSSKIKLENFSEKIWHKDLDVGLKSAMMCTKVFGNYMNKQKNGGNIINISSTSSEDCNFGRSAYSSSKAALETITKTLAYEIGPFNIRANCILPGLTDTDLMRDNTDKKVIEEVKKKIALRRLAEPKEIAELVKFLASEYSSYITGEAIRIDGGMQK